MSPVTKQGKGVNDSLLACLQNTLDPEKEVNILPK
jgi:hypothetical protein